MSEDVYVLKFTVEDNILHALNGGAGDLMYADRIHEALCDYHHPSLDELEDWINAIRSGKKIVNPLSPSEELKNYIRVTQNTYMADMKCVVAEVLEIIAKEHPDVADWLKESDQP